MAYNLPARIIASEAAVSEAGMVMNKERIGLLDIFGLKPLDAALAQAGRAVFGNNDIPPTNWDLSSIKVFKPHISIPTWLGVKIHGDKAPVYNLFNRNMRAG